MISNIRFAVLNVHYAVRAAYKTGFIYPFADAAPFVEFMLQALRDAMREAGNTDQVSDQVTDQVKMLLEAIGNSELSGSELMNALGFSHRPTFRANYLNPAMEGGWLDRTQPGSPRSPTQRYRLSAKAKIWLQTRNEA